MNRCKGYSLVEVAIVLVIISLLGGVISGFSNYRDRAEFLANGRTAELEELIAMDKRLPVVEDPDIPAPTPEPEVNDDSVDKRPVWVRWIEWWRSSGRRRA